VLLSGERRNFQPYPKEGQSLQDALQLDALTTRYSHARIVGTCRDALGAAHAIDETVDIREWWAQTQASAEMVRRD